MEYEYPIYKVRAGEYESSPGTLTCRFISLDHGFRYHSGNPEYNDEVAGLRSPHTNSFWRDPETLEEWLLCLPHPFGEMAAKALADVGGSYFVGSGYSLSEVKNPYDALFRAFNWSLSEQGHNFWRQVRRQEFPSIGEKKEKIPMLNIATVNKPGLYELASTLLRDKGYKVMDGTHVSGHENLTVFCVSKEGVYQIFTHTVSESDKILDLESFIKQINELPPAVTERKPKSFDSLVQDYRFTLTDKEILVGCQKLSYETFKKVQAQVLDFRKRSEKLEAGLDYDLHVTHAGIKVPDLSSSYLISFETFEKIEKEVAEYLK